MAVAPVRIRKDVYKLPAGDKTLEWYGKAVAEMSKRPINDPTSLRYQAAIHGYERDKDPMKRPGDVLPSGADQGKFWNQCQHNNWFFLSWHRGYLLYFENICRAAITRLGGPSDWALPYWNYSDAGNANAKRIPPAFRDAAVAGQPNPLYVGGRKADPSGKTNLDDWDVTLECLKRTRFVGGSTGSSPGFGGTPIGLGRFSDVTGAVEMTPHGTVHSDIGGLMSEFYSAGLDPLFYLHHCNIDRLWEVWRGRVPGPSDPTEAAWRNTGFPLHDEAGAPVSFASAAMVSTNALGYRYDIVADPLPRPAGGARGLAPQAARPTGPAPPASLAGASDGSVPLGGAPSATRMSLAPAPRPRGMGMAAAAPKRVFLNLENITGTGPGGSYSVYVNVPEGEDPADHPENMAGRLPLFGIQSASEPDGPHGGSGLTHVLEITGLAGRLKQARRWKDDDLRVVFVPKLAVAEGSDVKIGRVSVYYG